MQIFNCTVVSTPYPQVVQGSTLYGSYNSIWFLQSPGRAMVPVSTHVTACYHSALAATLLSVWARSVFKESQMRQAVYEEHDSESTLYTSHKQLQEVFSSTAHTYYVCSFCSGRSECHFFCLLWLFFKMFFLA